MTGLLTHPTGVDACAKTELLWRRSHNRGSSFKDKKHLFGNPFPRSANRWRRLCMSEKFTRSCWSVPLSLSRTNLTLDPDSGPGNSHNDEGIKRLAIALGRATRVWCFTNVSNMALMTTTLKFGYKNTEFRFRIMPVWLSVPIVHVVCTGMNRCRCLIQCLCLYIQKENIFLASNRELFANRAFWPVQYGSKFESKSQVLAWLYSQTLVLDLNGTWIMVDLSRSFSIRRNFVTLLIWFFNLHSSFIYTSAIVPSRIFIIQII